MSDLEFARFFADDFEQIEFPNRLLPNGAKRDVAAVLAGRSRGRAAMHMQRFEIEHVVAEGNVVVVEATWRGTPKVPFGNLPPGGEMTARFAIFLEFRDGKIARQRNYDCFDPF
jgi:ketosteroid isomerase-like protein